MTLESDYPLAWRRYQEINRFNEIRTLESLMNTLTGLDDPQDPYNPSIGTMTDLIRLTAKNHTGKISMLDVWSVVQVVRNFKEDGQTPEYYCINMPNARYRRNFAEVSGEGTAPDYAYNRLTTNSLDQAVAWYFWVIAANLRRWEVALGGHPGEATRTKADVLRDIVATVKDRTMFWRGFWGSAVGSGPYALLIKLETHLYAYQLQVAALDPTAPWKIGGASEAAYELAALSTGPRCASEIMEEIVAADFADPASYEYDVRGLVSKNAKVIYVSNSPAIRAYQVDGGAWALDYVDGEDIVAALV